MNQTASTADLIDQILTRTAEHTGDITPLVLAAYYRLHPTAEALFNEHAGGNKARLEGMMVENAVFFLMKWVESPPEVEFLINDSLEHHNDTLRVSPKLYSDLIECTAQVVADTIPETHAEERRAWAEVRQNLSDLVEKCHQELITRMRDH